MFDLELESMVGDGGQGRAHPVPPPLTDTHPLKKSKMTAIISTKIMLNICLPPLPLCSSLGINFVLSPFHCYKIKEGSFVFTEIILSSHTPELVLFCRLGQTFCRLRHATKLCKLEMINWWSMLYSTATCVRWIRFKGSVEQHWYVTFH